MKIPFVSGFLSRFRNNRESKGGEETQPQSSGLVDWDDELSLTLGSLVTDQDSKSYGTVQAITLSDFHDSIGTLWEKYEKNILLIAETTIDHMLAKTQTAIRQDDETWLLVTPDLTQKEAELFADSIAASIGEKLIGARFEANENADAVPQTSLVDLSEALNSDGSIDREAIRQAVESAKASIAAQAGRIKGGTWHDTKPLKKTSLRLTLCPTLKMQLKVNMFWKRRLGSRLFTVRHGQRIPKLLIRSIADLSALTGITLSNEKTRFLLRPMP